MLQKPKLLLIESPGKIKKLKSILGPDWTVKASMGHIRELASDRVDALGFDLNGNRVECRFVPRNQKASGIIKELKQVVKQYQQIYLATDPDREGETIAWHLAEVLNISNPQRVVMTEITESAVRRAIATPRPLDMNLVGSGQARACLDKLVGYRGSPLLWSLGNGAKSMGRVQSSTLHILCEREREIEAFKPTAYWSVFCNYLEGFRAFYLGSSEAGEPGEAVREIADDASDPEDIKKPEGSRVLSQAIALSLVEIALHNSHRVVKVEGKTASRKPPAPFITSTLQQAAGSRLKYNPKKTMDLAQSLYEKGLITYMRTDSVNLSPEFCASVRDWLQRKDPDNLPDKVVAHRASKNAQEAHEAIRPTDVNRSSASLKQELTDEEFQLYLIIWLRAVASQCESARVRKTKIITRSAQINWQASGQVVEFLGYAKYWKDLGAENELPSVTQGQILNLDKAAYEQKQTQPPPRYTEPKLVSAMEKKGIGRPSTYAPTVKTLKDRSYVELISGKLHVVALGLEVDEFLGKVLPELLSADFTAEMEENLDEIALGKKNWERYLTSWNSSYFSGAIAGAKDYLAKNGYSQNSSSKKENAERHQWELPSPKTDRSASPAASEKLTDYTCPVCRSALVEHEYTKDEQTKKMLRCSNPNARNDKKHKDVVFFKSKNRWWNKKYGELG